MNEFGRLVLSGPRWGLSCDLNIKGVKLKERCKDTSNEVIKHNNDKTNKLKSASHVWEFKVQAIHKLAKSKALRTYTYETTEPKGKGRQLPPFTPTVNFS